ncbi:DUF5625 family protein [Aliarcobacter butzleri]|uniref:DUF5625 family protein n=1 Tax=Aliarcobacter butzleri TaxID=28197 RepID=UPI001EDAB76C|nr:DUF5625 family protein [Aliarcobacter butzleri]MCG3659944.1 DUF5625 family protein [Aliarcobacter butzleri]
MTTLVKLLKYLSFVFIFVFSGCFSPRFKPIILDVNLEKAGVVADFNMTILKEYPYSFKIYYVYDRLQSQKNRAISPDEENYVNKIIGGNFMGPIKKGSKIVLKLTITPLFDLKKDYLYRIPEFSKIKTPQGSDIEKIMKNNKPFEYIIDLSEYDNSGGGGYYGYDTEIYAGIYKRIVDVTLPSGEYNIRLENLEDVPEIVDIKTVFKIQLEYRK